MTANPPCRPYMYRRRLTRSPIACWLALLCLTLRAMTPTGFMPGNATSGEWFSPCPSSFPATWFATPASRGHHHHEPADRAPDTLSADRPCAIGDALQSAALPSTPPPTTIVALPPVMHPAVDRPARASCQQRRPGARAPPQAV